MTPPDEQQGGVTEADLPLIKLVIVTAVLSVGSALLNNWIESLFGIPGPQQFFALSWWGISNLMLWQPLTYLFVQGTEGQGITLVFLVFFAIQMYMLYFMGKMVYDCIGPKSFFILYFGAGILSGLLTLFAMPLIGHYAVLSGPTTAIIAVFTVWTFLYPDMELLLLFILPVEARWILVTVIAGLFLVNISQLNFLMLFYYSIPIVIGYFYAVIGCTLRSPWEIMEPVDTLFARLGYLFVKEEEEEAEDETTPGAKLDPNVKIPCFNKEIETTKEKESDADDDAFIDEMLTKIAKEGESSLTWLEKNRMKKISEKKRKKDK